VLVVGADQPDEDDELGFEEVDMAIQKLGEKMLKRVNGREAAAHDSRGIDAPRYKPPSDPLTCIGVVEGVTVSQACEALPEAKALLVANARGVLVKGPAASMTLELARAVNRRAFIVFYDREDRSFMCATWSSGGMQECFALGITSTAGLSLTDSVLGETTIDGILRVLDISREFLIPDHAPAAGGAEVNEQ
jgi:hypothetical protein